MILHGVASRFMALTLIQSPFRKLIQAVEKRSDDMLFFCLILRLEKQQPSVYRKN